MQNIKVENKNKNKKNKNKSPEKQFGCFWLSVKAVVYDEATDKVLVLKRSRQEDFHQGAYDLPGGHVDKGEGVMECLQREVKDETGLEVEVGDILAVREYPKDHEMFDKIKALRFIAYYRGGKVKLSQEHESFEWLTFEEVKSKLSDDGYEKEKKETILLAQKYLQDHNSVEKWQRSIADFENYKRQTAKQNEEFKKYAAENIIIDILPVLDNFQASLEHIPEGEKESGWVTGILYIQKQLLDVLQNHGVQPMNVKVGDKFDANFHEAVKTKEQETNHKEQGTKKEGKHNASKEQDKISKVLKDGYKIGDKVIRPALVEVG